MKEFLSALEKQRKLRHQKVGVTQIEAMLKEAIKDLQEANLIKDLAIALLISLHIWQC